MARRGTYTLIVSKRLYSSQVLRDLQVVHGETVRVSVVLEGPGGNLCAPDRAGLAVAGRPANECGLHLPDLGEGTHAVIQIWTDQEAVASVMLDRALPHLRQQTVIWTRAEPCECDRRYHVRVWKASGVSAYNCVGDADLPARDRGERPVVALEFRCD